MAARVKSLGWLDEALEHRIRSAAVLNGRTAIDPFRIFAGTGSKPRSLRVTRPDSTLFQPNARRAPRCSLVCSLFGISCQSLSSIQGLATTAIAAEGLASATSLMVLINGPAPRYVKKAGCGLCWLRDVVGVQRLDSSRDHAGTD